MSRVLAVLDVYLNVDSPPLPILSLRRWGVKVSENNEELWDYEDLQGLDATEILEVINDLIDTIDTTPDYWAESVKMAKSLHIKLECYNEKYYYDNSSPSYCGDPLVDRTCGPFTLPELHDKLISLRESEGTNENRC